MRFHLQTNFYALCLLVASFGMHEVLADEEPLTPTDAIEIPGTSGRFDYLEIDGELDRLLANHTQNKTLDIINLTDGKLIKSIPTGAAQGAAIDAKSNRCHVTVASLCVYSWFF